MVSKSWTERLVRFMAPLRGKRVNKSTSARPSYWISRALLASALVGVLQCGVGIADAHPSISPYGEVGRFGGFDASASYGSSSTTGLVTVGQQAKFVYPLGMAVDTEDPNAPDKYAIYVLENTNPQAINAEDTTNEPTGIKLEYRIQKVSDEGTVLASTSFTLTSTPSEPGLRAVSLAVDGASDRVYVMLMDVPTNAENSQHFSAVVAVDAWTTGRNGTALAPAVKLTTGLDDNLQEDLRTDAGELAGPSVFQAGAFSTYIDGSDIAVYGKGATAELALAGNQYTSPNASVPTVDLVKISGAEAGAIEASPWAGAASTENESAKAVKQKSEELYSMSSDPDGSLNVSLGPGTGTGPKGVADLEPNMAIIGSTALAPTTPLLPSAAVKENAIKTETVSRENIDGSLTMGFSQDIHGEGPNRFQPMGSTPDAGTLSPSVVQLAGDDVHFPTGLYAGLVAHREGEAFEDKQNPVAGVPPAWIEAQGTVQDERREITSPGSLAIRIFDQSGDPLGMIGSVTADSPCNLQGSPVLGGFSESVPAGRPSFVALAPGREGVVFVLVQPNLVNTVASAGAPLISPASPVGAAIGDQLVEFAPGASSAGAGTRMTDWHECSQPSASVAVTNQTLKESLGAGSSEVAVAEGTTLSFSAQSTLHGASPWEYSWDLAGGTNSKGEGPLFEYPWTLRNSFTATPEEGHAWLWPRSTVEAEFKTPGTYTETLNLLNDFGALTSQRTLRVIAAGVIEDTKVTPSVGPTEGTPVLLTASATLPTGDKIKNYHWEFGDTQGEDTGEAAEAQHVYEQSGKYTVKLTITDALGKTASAEETVNVAAAAKVGKQEEEKHETKEAPKQEAPPAQQLPPAKQVTVTKPSPKPLTTAQKLAKALKACKKLKAKKKRATCEKAAKKKYAPKKKTKKKK